MLRFLSNTFKVDPEIIDILLEKHCSGCPLCKGRRTLELSDGKWEKCKCLQNYNKEYAFYAANIPIEFHPLTLDDFTPDWRAQNEEAFSRSIKYIQQLQKALDKGFGLYLGGNSGSGKSFIASIILKKAIEQKLSAYFILFRDFVSFAMNALRDPEVQEDIDHLVTHADFLVLDSIGDVTALGRDGQELINTVVLALLKKRKYSSKPLIVTSHSRRSELKILLGDDAASAITSGLSELSFTGDANFDKVKKLEEEFFTDE